jgi:hypothetical protein
MQVAKAQDLRRSSRVPIHLPVHVTSLDPNAHFSELCETLVVNAHGCALRLPIPLDAGSELKLHTREGRNATAHVVVCQPMGSDGWRLGARLDQPENFWGLKSYPDDWQVIEMPSPAFKDSPPRTAKSTSLQKAQPSPKPAQAILDKVEEQLSEDRLRGILAKLVRPLETEVTELQEKIARNSRQNRFEVSLGHIPPELQEQIWQRLRQELGPRVLEHAKEQTAEILSTAKTATEQKVSAALTEFRNRLSGELHTIEQRAQALSKDLTSTALQRAQAGVEKIEQQTLDARAQLTAQSEQLLSSLEGRLIETHNAHRREVDQIQAATSAKAAHLQSDVADLGKRIAAMNESVRRLESELDAHLERLAGEIVADARNQLEGAVAVALKDFQTRGSNEVDGRIDEVCSHLRSIQNRIEHSFSGSLEAQSNEATQVVGQRFEELASQASERWKMSLAKNLKSVANSLGQQLRQEFEGEDELQTAG